MKTRVTTRMEPQMGNGLVPVGSATPLAGVSVITAGSQAAQQLDWLLDRGASEVLIVPAQFTPPTRVLIHWTAEDARRATLAVAASVLRHVPAEATYLNIVQGAESDAQKPGAMRELLDARSEAQAVHGLEMRTELHYGDAAQELARQLHEKPDQMLILGVTARDELRQGFASLLQHSPGWPVLVVFRGSDAQLAQRKLA